MTSDLSHDALDALTPVRAYLATTAQNDASAATHATQTQAEEILKDAESERERAIAEAVDEGQRTANAAAALTSARVRRQANEVVLAQRESIRQGLRTAVEQAATALRDEPQYPTLRAELVAHGRAVLGEDATITDVPQGGILVETGSRRLDLSLPTLATLTLDAMEAEVSSLWTR